MYNVRERTNSVNIPFVHSVGSPNSSIVFVSTLSNLELVQYYHIRITAQFGILCRPIYEK